jgi:hypothetical protein
MRNFKNLLKINPQYCWGENSPSFNWRGISKSHLLPAIF